MVTSIFQNLRTIPGEDSNLLWDDKFDTGTCGWEHLFQFPSDWNTTRYLPLTLSPRGKIGKYALRLQTNSTPFATYGGGAFAIKRRAHQPQPGVTNKGIVKHEWWFTVHSDAPATANGYNSYSPRTLEFNIDSDYPTSVQTSANDGSTGIMGRRAFFVAKWQQSSQSGSNQNYTGQWFLNQNSGLAYGAGGYTDPINTAAVATGYYSNIFFNQGKRSLQYVSITVDTYNGTWIEMQVNHLVYDLTRIPSLSNGPMRSVLALDDPTYQTTTGEFSGGLNPIIQVDNVLNTGFVAASDLELHRARGSYI